MSGAPAPTVAPRARRVRMAALRALVLGFICTVAVSVAASLREPASTPASKGEATRWLASVPAGWPAAPWSEARRASGWAREVWELHADPLPGEAERAKGFPAQWVLRCGWPMPAFECVRNRLRALWDQGSSRPEPTEGPSATMREGVVIQAGTLGASEGQFLIPVTPLWGGLLVDTIAWALPFFALAVITPKRGGKSTTPPAP